MIAVHGAGVHARVEGLFSGRNLTQRAKFRAARVSEGAAACRDVLELAPHRGRCHRHGDLYRPAVELTAGLDIA